MSLEDNPEKVFGPQYQSPLVRKTDRSKEGPLDTLAIINITGLENRRDCGLDAIFWDMKTPEELETLIEGPLEDIDL